MKNFNIILCMLCTLSVLFISNMVYADSVTINAAHGGYWTHGARDDDTATSRATNYVWSAVDDNPDIYRRFWLTFPVDSGLFSSAEIDSVTLRLGGNSAAYGFVAYSAAGIKGDTGLSAWDNFDGQTDGGANTGTDMFRWDGTGYADEAYNNFVGTSAAIDSAGVAIGDSLYLVGVEADYDDTNTAPEGYSPQRWYPVGHATLEPQLVIYYTPSGGGSAEPSIVSLNAAYTNIEVRVTTAEAGADSILYYIDDNYDGATAYPDTLYRFTGLTKNTEYQLQASVWTEEGGESSRTDSLAVSTDADTETAEQIDADVAARLYAGADATYSDARNNTDADNYSASNMAVGQRSTFYVYRSLLEFVIPDIPDGSTATACSLYLYGTEDLSVTDFNINLFTAYFGASGTTADFNAFDGWEASGSYTGTILNETFSSSSFVTDWNSVEFNSAGLDTIEVYDNSTLQLAMLSNRDVSYTEPTGDEALTFNEADSTAYLSLTYTETLQLSTPSIAATDTTTSSIDLSITSVDSDADSVVIEVDDTYNGAVAMGIGETTASYTVSGLSDDTNYDIRVYAKGTDYTNSAYSDTLSITTDAAPAVTSVYAFADTSGTGTDNSGDDWNNPILWDDLFDGNNRSDTNMTRGYQYLVADGDYGGTYTFNTATSDTTTIVIRKATESYHGTETGWDSAYGDGQAEFDGIYVSTDDWIFDGAAGADSTGHGFRLYTTATSSDSKVFHIGNGADNISLIHAEVEHAGMDNGDYSQDCVYVVDPSDGGSQNLYFGYCYLHDVNRVHFLCNYVSDSTFEHLYIAYRSTEGTVHGEAMSFNSCGSPANNVIRYCTVKDVLGTGHIVIKDAVQSHFYIYGNVFFSTDPATYEVSNGVICNTSGDTNTYMYIYNNTTCNMEGINVGLFFDNGSNNTARNNVWYCPNATTISFSGVNVLSNNGADIDLSQTDDILVTTDDFTNYASYDFSPSEGSSLELAGYYLGDPYDIDMDGNNYGNPPTIGALATRESLPHTLSSADTVSVSYDSAIITVDSVDTANADSIIIRNSGLRFAFGLSDSASMEITGLDDDTLYDDLYALVKSSAGYSDSIAVTTFTTDVAPRSITLTVPTGGETFVIGINYNITWTEVNTGTVQIDWSPNGGVDWVPIATGVTGSDGTYPWVAPDTTTTEGQVRIADEDSTYVLDISGNFNISEVTPSSGTVLPLIQSPTLWKDGEPAYIWKK